MPNLYKSGAYVRKLLAAAYDKEKAKKLPDAETSRTLGQQSENEAIPTLAGIGLASPCG